MKAKRFLTVDGDFFCHRTIHGMRMINKDITLESSDEMNNYNKSLINSVHSLFNTFVNEHHQLIDQIIFVFDNKSWRKSVPPHKPYYIEDDTPIGYKDNRKKLKEDSDINYDNFNLCKSEFINELTESKVFPVFCIEGAEGDDLLMMLKTRLLMENSDNKMLVFCTDGDLKQLLYNKDSEYNTDSVMLFRNIKSGAAPEGEWVISKEQYNKIYGTLDANGKEDVMDMFLRASENSSNQFDENYYKNFVFNINFKDSSGKATFQRNPGAGISVATPTLTLLTKMVIGDKKDNIFPIMRWKTKTGTAVRNVTENHLIKVFDELDLKFNDESAQKIYTDKTMLTKMLYSLRDEVKQTDIDIQTIGSHFVHNRKLLDIRTINYFPENICSIFNIKFDEYNSINLFDTILDKQKMTGIKMNFVDSTNILSNSLPDLPAELQGFSDLL